MLHFMRFRGFIGAYKLLFTVRFGRSASGVQFMNLGLVFCNRLPGWHGFPKCHSQIVVGTKLSCQNAAILRLQEVGSHASLARHFLALAAFLHDRTPACRDHMFDPAAHAHRVDPSRALVGLCLESIHDRPEDQGCWVSAIARRHPRSPWAMGAGQESCVQAA